MDNQMNNEEIEIDLLEILGILRAKIFSIIMSGMLLAAVFGIGTLFFIEPKYVSTSELYIVGQSSGITSLTDLQTGSQLTQDYMVVVKSRPVIDKVIENLKLDMEYEDLLEIISIENQNDTRILDITVKTDDPYMAKEIADELSSVFISRISSIMGGAEPTIVENGYIQSEAESPNVHKNILLGGIIGMVLYVAVFVGMYLLDDTIRTEEDVEKYLKLNTLAMIPVEGTGAMAQIIKDRKKREGKPGIFSSIKNRK